MIRVPYIIVLVVILIAFSHTTSVEAHRSGCHRWHSCPSDSGSYTCGDTGHPCSYPTYPNAGTSYSTPIYNSTPINKPSILPTSKPTIVPTNKPSPSPMQSPSPEVKGVSISQSPTPPINSNTYTKDATAGDTAIGLGFFAILIIGGVWALKERFWGSKKNV